MASESVQNIVTSTLQNDPQALQSALDNALREKITAALESKKQEISKNLVGLGEGRQEKNALNRQIKKSGDSKDLVAAKKLTGKQWDRRVAKVDEPVSEATEPLSELKYPKGFKGSKFDDDNGVVPGSAADKRRDAKEIPKFLAAKKKDKSVTESVDDGHREEHRVRFVHNAMGPNQHGFMHQNRTVNHPKLGTSAWENVKANATLEGAKSGAHADVAEGNKKEPGRHVYVEKGEGEYHSGNNY